MESSSTSQRQELLRQLPAVDRVLHEPSLQELASRLPHVILLECAQEAVAMVRRSILADAAGAVNFDFSPASLARDTAHLAQKRWRPSLRPVINATGTLLHTNLGRAPLSDAALEAMHAVSQGYSNLEFDLDRGERGHRYSHIEDLLCRLTGAEAATVVNNNAGAVLLCLTALARGKEAIVSRGELVEIGGAFRVPDVMAAGGVILKEVGTTNKTHLRDYREAISEETGLLLKIHTSNYRIVGFTADVPAAEIVVLGRETSLPVMEDLGSGMLMDLSAFGLPQEPTVRDTINAGVDVVTFSGDKLLGGPQAGLIVGRRAFVERIRKHPMARALRIDKLTLAALEATLRHYLDEKAAVRDIPTLRMLALTPEEIRRRCRRLSRRLSARLVDEAGVTIVPEASQVGGGALPLTEIPGFALAISPGKMTATELATRLRHGDPPVIGRLQEDRLLLNPRSIEPREEQALIDALALGLESGD